MASANRVLFDIVGKYSNQGAIKKFNADVAASVNSYKGLVGQVTNLNRSINIFGATIRQVGQGLQNLGTTITAFVSLPLTAVLYQATSGLLELDKQLIEIRKNAGLSFDALEEVKDGLVDLSRTTPTALAALAEIAATAGRAGIVDTGQILGFVKVVDQLSQATALNTDEAAKWSARLANIFYKPTQNGKTYIEFLSSVGSAINELGQNIVGSEQEIVSAAVRMAPSAASLGINVQDLLGIAAALVEMSTSAERVGTQANRAFSELAANAVKIADSLGINVDTFRDLIDSNPVEVFLGVADAIGRMSSNSLRAAASEQLFGQIGGKVVNLLGEMTGEHGKVFRAIAISNRAFEEGTSLQMEFERSLDAVTSQLGLLRNNLNVIAVSIGDVLLPIVTRILSFAVPIIRIFADWFDGLSDRVKLATVGFLLLGAVLGPLLFAIGSTLFSLGIITTGLTTAIAGIFGLLTAPLRLAAGFIGLITPMRVVIVTIGAVIAAVSAFGTSIPSIISGLSGIASSLYSWGANLLISFADGMRSAMNSVISVVTQILSFVSTFFESHSPPKAGPLREMDKWGRNVAQSFVDGFSSARMTPVLRFGGLIAESLESALRTVSGTGATVFNGIRGLATSAATALAEKLGLEDIDVDKRALGAMEAIAEAVTSVVNSGQVASGIIEKMNSALGPFVNDFLGLVDAQVRYNNAVERLSDIRKQQELLDVDLQKEIERISALTDITAAERAALIRGARLRRNAREKELDEQERAAEEQVDITKSQVDAQEGLISSLIEALRVSTQKPLKDDLIKVPEFNLGDIGIKLQEARDEIDSLFDNANEEGGRFISMMDEATRIVKAFWAGLTGADVSTIADLFYGNESGDIGPIGEAFLAGGKVKTSIDEIRESFEGASEKLGEFKENLLSLWSGDFDAVFSSEQIEQIKKAGVVLAGVGLAIATIQFGPTVLSALGALSAVLSSISLPIVLVGAALLALGAAFLDMEPRIIPVKNAFELVQFWIATIRDALVGSFLLALQHTGTTSEELARAAEVLGNILRFVGWVLFEVLKAGLEIAIVVLGGLLTALAAVAGYLAGALVGAFVWVINIIDRFVYWIQNGIGDSVEDAKKFLGGLVLYLLVDFVYGIWKAITDVGDLFGKIAEFLMDVQMNGAKIGADAAIALTYWLEHTVPDSLSRAWSGILDLFSGWVTDVAGWGSKVATAFLDGWKSFDASAGISEWLGGLVPFLRGESPPKQGPLSQIDVWGRNVAGGFVSGFSSANVSEVQDFAALMANTLVSGMMVAIASAEKRLTEVALAVAGIVAKGFAMNSTNAADYMDSILMASGLWVIKRASVLKSFGSSIADHILNGISGRVEESSSVFDIISRTFSSWKSLFFGGSNEIVRVARDVGELMAQAIADGIKLKSVVVGTAIVDMIGGISLVANVELSRNVEKVGAMIGGQISEAIRLSVNSIASVENVMLGLLELLLGVKRAIETGQSRYAVKFAAYDVGVAIANEIARGIRSVNAGALAKDLLNGSRIGERVDSGMSEFGGFGDYIQNVYVTISGDVVVDNERRVKDLAGRVAYELGRNTNTRYRMGGVGV